jgi:hypothetical protein
VSNPQRTHNTAEASIGALHCGHVCAAVGPAGAGGGDDAVDAAWSANALKSDADPSSSARSSVGGDCGAGMTNTSAHFGHLARLPAAAAGIFNFVPHLHRMAIVSDDSCDMFIPHTRILAAQV